MTNRSHMPWMERLFAQYRAGNPGSATTEHLEYLLRLASTCRHVTELGCERGASTCAFLYAEPEVLVSVDVNRLPELDELEEARAAELTTVWQFRQEDSRAVCLDPTDLLFIDTVHNHEHIELELAAHALKVRRYLVFHDTVTYGDREIGDREGIWRAICQFCRAHPEWVLLEHHAHQHGLTVLARLWNPDGQPHR